MRRVTIFSDASYCARTKAGGWGCWVKTDRASAVIKGGAFRDPPRDSLAAELMGIANALVVTRNAGWLCGSWVMVQCDSLNALQIVRRATGAEDSPADGGLPTPVIRRMPPKRPDLAAIADAIKGVMGSQGTTIVVRHVRGHQQGEGRQFVNRLVDQTARKAMKAKRRSA